MARIEAKRVDTFYEVDGEGEPVELLHAGLVTIDSLNPRRAALAARYRLYLPRAAGPRQDPDVAGIDDHFLAEGG